MVIYLHVPVKHDALPTFLDVFGKAELVLSSKALVNFPNPETSDLRALMPVVRMNKKVWARQ